MARCGALKGSGAGAGGAAGAGDTEASGWYYRDPKGKIHGPWKAGDIAKWFRAGFYGRDLPVRKGSSGEWTTLAQAMPYVTGDDADSKGGGGSRKQGKGGKSRSKGTGADIVCSRTESLFLPPMARASGCS